MKERLIRFLLLLLGVDEQRLTLPKLPIYVLFAPGERLGEVTTNQHRAIAIAREAEAKGETLRVYQYEAIRKVRIR